MAIDSKEAKLGLLVKPCASLIKDFPQYKDFMGELLYLDLSFTGQIIWRVYWFSDDIEGPWYLTSLDKLNK